MNQNLPSILKGGLIMLALLVLGINANATTFTATTSGNFSSAATWSGGTAPGTNITVDDNIIINTGVTVNLDVDLTINSANASVVVNGTLTGMHNLDFQDGSLQGAGSLNVATLTMGSLSTSAYLGDITAINLSNYQSTLLLAGATNVTGTLGLYAGTVQLGVGTQVVMGNGSTIEMGGGNYQLGTGNITLQGNVNLLYSGSGNRNMGIEMSLSPINSITVNLASGSQMNITDDVVVTGQLSVQGGSLNTNGFDLTVNGTVATSGNGRFMGDSSSIINVNGSGNVGTLAFDSANSVIDALNINISGNGSVSLGSNLTANNGVGLTSGALVIGSNHLTIYGPITGSGTFTTTSESSLTVNHNGNNNYLNFTAGADTIGNLSISSGASGSAGIGTNLTVMGMLSLGSGTFTIDPYNLTLNGTLDSTGTGTISGGPSANLTIGGNANNIGKLTFTQDSTNVVHNLTLTNTNAGWIYLGTSLTITQSLILNGGRIGLLDSSNLLIIGTDTINGGSDNSYVATLGTGSLYINIPDSTSPNGYDDAMLHIGTQTNYAPVRIYNNGSQVGTFAANAHGGIFADGISGSDISTTKSSVNTSWNVSSNLDTNNVAIEAFWSAGMEVNQFNRNDVWLSHYTAGAWDSITGMQAKVTSSGMISAYRSDITSFSPFAVFSNPIATGIIEPTAKAQIFTLFPNPATTQTYVALANADKNYELRITDVAGKQVGFYNVNDTNNIIDVNNLAPGIYFFTLNNLHTQRFVKQ